MRHSFWFAHGMSPAFVARWLVAGASLFTASQAAAQSIVTGVVRSDSTGQPLGGVEVTIEGAKARAQTDSLGKYALESPGGNQIAVFRLPGYQPLRLRVIVKKDTVHADASLLRAVATQLPAVEVNAPTRVTGPGREGFAERRAQGFGKFIDSTALRVREERRLSDVLRELAGVRLTEYHEPNSSIIELRAISPLSTPSPSTQYDTPKGRMNVPGIQPCWVSVFFNGSTIYRSERTNGGRPPDLSRDFSVASLESVEYYRTAAETPQQFGGGNANCGALVLWSRR
jgi:hypothetical protein